MKNEVKASVKFLRQSLGDTQQQFADRFHVVVRTVARWEADRPPSGAVLMELAAAADSQGLAKEAETFRQAFKAENKLTLTDLYSVDQIITNVERHALNMIGMYRGQRKLLDFLEKELKALLRDVRKNPEILVAQKASDKQGQARLIAGFESAIAAIRRRRETLD